MRKLLVFAIILCMAVQVFGVFEDEQADRDILDNIRPRILRQPAAELQELNNRWIVELAETPVALYEKQLKNTGENDIGQKVADYRNQLENTHSVFRNELSSKEINVLREYKTVFNGFAVDASQERITQISSDQRVKKVYQDHKVEALLQDSVPLINADDLWDLRYVGRGITISIIDSGIDYTHGELEGVFWIWLQSC